MVSEAKHRRQLVHTASPSIQKGPSWSTPACTARPTNTTTMARARTGGAVLVVAIAVLSAWAHNSLSTTPGAPNAAAKPSAITSAAPFTPPPTRVQLRTWLTRAEPSIHALVTARREIASAAANHDITGTGAACRTADGAVANLQHHLPSPDPMLDASLQQAISAYRMGVRYCISGVQNNDADDIEQAATYFDQGNADLEAAVDIPERDLPGSEPAGTGVMTI
jgi:hypothetical protein